MQKPSCDGSPAIAAAEPPMSPAASRRNFLKLAGAAAAGPLLAAEAGAAGKTRRKDQFDVVVVGGGFAGVTAARELAHAGARVVLLEARNRLGGRTFYSQFGDKKVELGGTWIHYSQPHVWAEITRYDLAVAETPGVAHPERVLWMSDGKVIDVPMDESWALLKDALDRFHVDAKKVFERPFLPYLSAEGEALDQMSIADRLAQMEMTPAQRDLMNGMMATNCHSPTSSGAYTEMLRWWSLVDGDAVRLLYSCARYKLKDGTSALIDRMVADGGFQVRLSTAVERVTQSADRVTLVTEQGETITSRYVVMAVPVNTTRGIDFNPPLRPGKQEMANAHHAGKGSKLYLKVKGRLDSVLFFAPETELFSMVFTESAGEDGGVLVAFGPSANSAVDLKNPKAIEPFIRKFLPDVSVEQVLGYDWHLDPYSLGTWCTLRPGQYSRHLRDLRAHEGRLFFAGSDIAAGWRGFIDGAIESGLHVAHTVSGELRQKA